MAILKYFALDYIDLYLFMHNEVETKYFSLGIWHWPEIIECLYR